MVCPEEQGWRFAAPQNYCVFSSKIPGTMMHPSMAHDGEFLNEKWGFDRGNNIDDKNGDGISGGASCEGDGKSCAGATILKGEIIQKERRDKPIIRWG